MNLQWLKKAKERLGGIDGFIVALGVALFSVSMYFFQQDDGLIEVDTNAKNPIVGTISTARNNVRRRTQSGFTWSNVKPADEVFEGDSIFTDESAQAQIGLNNGGELNIEPKSLVVIKTRNTSLQVDLRYGSLAGKVKSEAPIVIAQNGVLQELRGQDAEIRLESAGPEKETKIRVLKGEVQLKRVTIKPKTKDVEQIREQRTSEKPAPTQEIEPDLPTESNPMQVIKENEVAELKIDAKTPVIIRDSAELVSPDNGKNIWLKPDKNLKFSWRLVGKAFKKSRFELTTDPLFKKIWKTQETEDFQLSLAPDQLPKGLIHWRVIPIASSPAESASDGQESGISSLPFEASLYPDIPPHPLAPANGEEFQFKSYAGETGKQILIKWNDASGSTSYSLQISRSPDFKKILFTKNLSDQQELTALLAEGEYFWRVRGLHGDRHDPPWSPAWRFAIKEDVGRPERPILTNDKLDFEIPFSLLEKAAGRTALKGRKIKVESIPPFNWHPTQNTDSYQIEIAEDESFKDPTRLDVGNQTAFAPTLVKPGALFVRVRAKGKRNLLSEPSQTGRLDIKMAAPRLLPLKPERQVFSTESDFEKGQHSFPLSWSELPFAEKYEVHADSNLEFKAPQKITTPKTHRDFKVTKSGDYAVRVRALGADGTPLGPFSDPQVASYRKELVKPIIVAKPTATPAPTPVAQASDTNRRKPSSSGGVGVGPALLEPKASSSFVSLSDSMSFVNLRWQPLDGARAYEVEIATDDEFTHSLGTFKTRISIFTVKKELPAGKVYWRVRAVRANNVPTQWSDVYDLNVIYQ